MRLAILIRRLHALPPSGNPEVDQARKALVVELSSLPDQRVHLYLNRRGLVVPDPGLTLDQALAAVALSPPRHRASRRR